MENIAGNRLEQVKFLHALAEDFHHAEELYKKARPILVEYWKIPKKMTEGEWARVVDALSECYQGVRFLYKIALLTESGVIDEQLLYIFYYDEIADNLTLKLNALIRWCGTGLDLAANYNSYEMARTATRLITLCEKLNAVHQEHGADLTVEGASIFLENFKERTRGFFTCPSEFDVASPDYVDRYVAVPAKRRLRSLDSASGI